MPALREHLFRGDKPEIEIVDGRRVPKMSPKTRHSRVQTEITMRMYAWARDRGAVGNEWRFHISGLRSRKDSYVPDVAFLSFERLRPLAGADREEPPFAPDVAVEIWSPGDREATLALKIERYLAFGGVLVLDVRPLSRTIVAHASSGECRYEDGATFTHVAVPGLTFELASLFDDAERTAP